VTLPGFAFLSWNGLFTSQFDRLVDLLSPTSKG
jgi:hypothetical protein